MPKIKNIIIFAVIAVALVLVYIFFIPKASNTASLISSPANSTTTPGVASGDTGAVAQDFLTLLLSVNSIKLDDSIFSDPAFSNLHDSSITLTPDATVGRPNPFAPLSATNTSVSTPPVAPVTPAPPTSIPVAPAKP